MKKIPFTLIALLAATAQADVSVSKIFGSHMVLQRDMPVPVWGRAAPGTYRVPVSGDPVFFEGGRLILDDLPKAYPNP